VNRFFLLDAPYSGADIFLHHYEKQSNGAIKRFRDKLHPKAHGVQRAVTTVSPIALLSMDHAIPLQHWGIMLCDPAVRLAKAYCVLRELKQTKASFQEYYNHPKRANLFSKILANKPLEELGFVGVHEHMNGSLHLASTWLSLEHRLKHHHGLAYEYADTSQLLTATHRANIKELHANDYRLYEKALHLVSTRLHGSYPAQTLALSKQKNILIHVGPPKTGTSAIQAWLLKNRKQLKKAGVYYPKHLQDENEISSGNFLSILSKNEDTNEYDIDLPKLQQLLEKFEAMHCNTLLLSSEHFHNHLISLFCYLPNAQYIFYVRHPLSIIESSYHQEVKRHGRKTLLKLPTQITFNHFMAFLNVCSEFATVPAIRFYDKALLEGDNLIADFTALLSPEPIKLAEDKKVNPRLGFGELELMRVCNHFLNENTAAKLDRSLQKQSHNTPSFTLIQTKDIERAKQELQLQVSQIFTAYSGLIDSPEIKEKLTQLTTLSFNLPHKDQSSYSEDVLAAWQTLKHNNIALAHDIVVQHRLYTKQTQAELDTVFLPWGFKDRARRIKSALKLG
jgi:hypothetical protein